METTGPPTALAIRIGAELEQHIYDLRAIAHRDERGRVEGEDRLVDRRAQRRMAFEKTAHLDGVRAIHGALQLIDERQRFRGASRHALLRREYRWRACHPLTCRRRRRA